MFPDGVTFTPVPNPLFGRLMEEIQDITLLKCVLRTIWMHYQKTGFPRFLTFDELRYDDTIRKTVAANGKFSEDELQAVLNDVVSLGVLLKSKVSEHANDANGIDVYILNTEEGRESVKYLNNADSYNSVLIKKDSNRDLPIDKANIFKLYEQNIGVITPIMSDELKEAESIYPEDWLDEAFKQAVLLNKRNWRYIEAILKRWHTEGKYDGESGRDIKKVDSREWIRKYGLERPS